VFCAPDLAVEPTLSIDNLIGAPRVESIATGAQRRLATDAAFEATLAMGIPTVLSWLELTLETTLAPFSADNEVKFEAELNLVLLKKEWTAGWLDGHFDVIDQVSPRARPGGASAYTHKLDLELDVAFHPFAWLRDAGWLQDVALETSFDYLATGLPKRGDVIEGKRYLDDATGWSLSLLIVLPLAPLERW
jgi:hypothetical protein